MIAEPPTPVAPTASTEIPPDNWYRVTDWCDPEDQIESQWGNVRWTTWLFLEAGRRGVKGNACKIVTKGGEQALFACYNSRWAWRDVDGESD
jgi:hypothetical protein